MAKRFTEVNKWKDDWYSSLSNDHKIVWQYLNDHCSIAGIIKKGLKHLNYFCNTSLNEMELLEIFKGKLIECGDSYFIPTFLVDQYPAGISSEKPLIVSVRKELESLFNHYPIIQESLPNDYRIIKVKEKVMVKDKEKDKETEKVKEKKILNKETIKAVINSIDEKDLHQLQLFIRNNCSNISKLKDQLTFEQASKLWEEVNHQVLGDVIAAMENKADLTKKYKSVYLTIHNWVKNQKSHGQRNSNSSENRFADLEQQLERSLQGIKFEI